MTSASKEEIGCLLDALYLEMLHLIQQQATVRMNIEGHSNNGQLLLAKTRYVQGTQTVSAAQIPTENSADFKALTTVVTAENTHDPIVATRFELQTQAVNKSAGYVDPLKWFGILAPSTLRSAASQFRKCLELVVESANIQSQLLRIMQNITHIKAKYISN